MTLRGLCKRCDKHTVSILQIIYPPQSKDEASSENEPAPEKHEINHENRFHAPDHYFHNTHA